MQTHKRFRKIHTYFLTKFAKHFLQLFCKYVQKVKNLSKNVLFYQNMSYLSESETDIVPETRLLELMRTSYFAKKPKATFLLLPYSPVSNLTHYQAKYFRNSELFTALKTLCCMYRQVQAPIYPQIRIFYIYYLALAVSKL